MKDFSIAIHGGAGTILESTMTTEKRQEYHSALDAAIEAGFQVLASDGKAIDAVQAAVISLEDCPLFNAGRGSVFTHEQKHEMDASMMDGGTMKAGSVAAIRNLRNPIILARHVMDDSEHVLLTGAGAEEFARKFGLNFEPDEYFFTQFRYDQLMEIYSRDETRLDHSEKKFGTVGAVACDKGGNIAAATSTGGMTNKRFGRIGDSAIIGAGTYANNRTCAVSCTGHGEYFLRSVVAYDIACLMEYKQLPLQEACEMVVLGKLQAVGGEGGVVAVDAEGNTCLVFNTDGMYRGMKSSSGRKAISIFRS